MSTLLRKESRKYREHGRRVLLAMALQRRYAALDLAEKLAHRRAELSLTQEGAAEKIGVRLRTYQRWESGDATPQDRNVYRVARAFGLKPSDLVVEPPRPNGTTSDDQLDRIEQKLDHALSLLCTNGNSGTEKT